MGALYGGLNLFGEAVKVVSFPNQRAFQATAYPGLDGIEYLDMGGRGRTTIVRSILVGEDGPTLKNKLILIESYQDGVPRIFVDSTGFAWRNVILDTVKPDENIKSAGLRGFYIPITTTLLHLSQS